MSIPDFPFIDTEGYDPYNHVGKQIRRHELFRKMQNDMRDKVFVMDTSALDVLKQFDFRTELENKVKDAFMLRPSLLGARVITHDAAFRIKTDA